MTRPALTPAEHDVEHAIVFAEYRQTARDLRREPTQALRDLLAAECQMLNYSDRARTEAGGWPRYYRAGPRLHTDPLCRALTGANSQAFVLLLPKLSGVTDPVVINQEGKLCRHCLRGSASKEASE